jgi:hypothetical protein
MWEPESGVFWANKKPVDRQKRRILIFKEEKSNFDIPEFIASRL